jgi:hypothetical protein
MKTLVDLVEIRDRITGGESIAIGDSVKSFG